MSTILDALRKVEGERRASSPSTRQRLLLFPQMTLPAASWYRGVWMLGIVLVGMGFASGLGVALWRSGARVMNPAGQPVSLGSTLREQPSVPPAPLPSKSAGAGDATTHLSRGVASTPAPVGQVSPAERRPVGLPKLSLAGSLHNQLQDPLQSQTLGSLSSLDIPSQNNRLNSRHRPLPQSQPQRNPLKISLNLLQWSPEVEKRRAAIRVNNGPMLTVHEGKTVSDLTVERILPDAVELRFDKSTTVKLRLGDSILHGQPAR